MSTQWIMKLFEKFVGNDRLFLHVGSACSLEHVRCCHQIEFPGLDIHLPSGRNILLDGHVSSFFQISKQTIHKISNAVSLSNRVKLSKKSELAEVILLHG